MLYELLKKNLIKQNIVNVMSYNNYNREYVFNNINM